MRKLALPLLGIAGFFAVLFYIVNLASPQNFPGCKPLNTRDRFDPSLTAAVWQNQNITPLLGLKNKLSVDQQKVLGIESQDKTIEISLSEKKLTAKKGNEIFLETPVNIGKYITTPVGDFSVIRKFLSVDLSGGSTLNKTYYYLPNSPFTIYFQDDFALIGAYWSKSFGGESGFGCIELPPREAEQLFYWADSSITSSSPGTRIKIIP